MTDLPTNQKAGSTPGSKLPTDATRQRETERLPGGTPGWIAIPQWPVPTKESHR